MEEKDASLSAERSSSRAAGRTEAMEEKAATFISAATLR